MGCKPEAFEHAERVNFLQRIFLFSDWEDEMLTRLAQVVIRRKYGKNETIIQGQSQREDLKDGGIVGPPQDALAELTEDTVKFSPPRDFTNRSQG